MPTNKSPIPRPHRHDLDHWQELSLWLSDRPDQPAFESEEARRAAWFYHRDRLMAAWAKHGKRPAAWWDYAEEAPRRPRDHDYEEAALYEAGLLTETEVAELTKLWRERFEQAQRPGFSYCIGHAKPGDTFASWLEGEAAKKAHYKWSGIPKALLGRWVKERKRRSKAIRKLETASSAEPAV
jgi:hypothetical protein